MNKLSKLIAVSVVGLSTSAMAVTFVASANAKNFEISGVRAEGERNINFASANITRRVYFYIDGVWSDSGTAWQGYNYVLHYTLDSGTNWLWSGDAKSFYGDYYQGLYYVDISGVGVGASFTAQVKSSCSDSSYCYTRELTIPSLADKTYDVIHVESGNDGYGHRQASLSQAGAAEIYKIVSFLNFMNTCDDSYAFGYNAYPQFKANFLDPANAAAAIASYGSTSISDKDKQGHDGYNVQNKIDKLEELYDSLGWIVA